MRNNPLKTDSAARTAITPTLNMPLELQIIRASEFVKLGAHGHFDLAASKVALAELATACHKRGINQALLDLRALHPGPKPVFTPADLLELVSTFREIGFTHELRLAILYQSDPHHRARLFAFISTLRGWTVQAFSDFEKAIMWLSQGNETPAGDVRSPRGKQIPVRTLKRETKLPAPAKSIRSVRSRSISATARTHRRTL